MKSAHSVQKMDPRLMALTGELRAARRDLSAAYRCLDQAADPELVECWVYRVNAEMARYNYLLRAIKSHSPPG